MILSIIILGIAVLLAVLFMNRKSNKHSNTNYDEINCDNMSQFADSCLPELTHGSFLVKINYANLSDAEIKAFTSGLIHISYFKTESNSPVIFIVFDFNGMLKIEVSINLIKLNIPLENWVNTKEDIVTLYLFERMTGSVSGIRSIKLRYLEALKEALFYQERYTSEQIDNEILAIRNKFSINDMERYACASEIIANK